MGTRGEGEGGTSLAGMGGTWGGGGRSSFLCAIGRDRWAGVSVSMGLPCALKATPLWQAIDISAWASLSRHWRYALRAWSPELLPR